MNPISEEIDAVLRCPLRVCEDVRYGARGWPISAACFYSVVASTMKIDVTEQWLF